MDPSNVVLDLVYDLCSLFLYLKYISENVSYDEFEKVVCDDYRDLMDEVSMNCLAKCVWIDYVVRPQGSKNIHDIFDYVRKSEKEYKNHLSALNFPTKMQQSLDHFIHEIEYTEDPNYHKWIAAISRFVAAAGEHDIIEQLPKGG